MERRLSTTSDWTQAHMPKLRSYLAFLVTANSEQPEYQNYFQDPNNSFIDLTHDENESCNPYIIEENICFHIVINSKKLFSYCH